jgi:type I restriction enzyme M protein
VRPTRPSRITWPRDEFFEDLDSQRSPEVTARQSVEDLAAALAGFAAFGAALGASSGVTDD